MKGEGGFLILEVLISGLILTASIAATMMLFRVGYQHLERVDRSNTISEILPQVINLLQTKDLYQDEGEEELGQGVRVVWTVTDRIQSTPKVFAMPIEGVSNQWAPSLHHIFLVTYQAKIINGDLVRDYDFHIFRSESVRGLTATAS